MDAFYERLIVRAATIDEILSDDFETLPGQKGDADLAARRLAAWCQSCASGDWSLFGQRLGRDGWAIDEILKRFATIRRKASTSAPAWVADAIWIEAALQSQENVEQPTARNGFEPCAFEHLFAPVVKQATELLWSGIDPRILNNLAESAHACLRHSLLKELSNLSAPAIYEQFVKARKTSKAAPDAPTLQRGAVKSPLYNQFIAEMKAGGFRRLFEDKPVLLRLIAVTTRQWIEISREFVLRLDADLPTIRRDILCSNADSPVAKIEGGLSDPHNGGRSVRIVSFVDGARAVYKPKDLRLDIAWHRLIGRLNRANPPIELKTVRAIAPDGYGWTEFIAHTECADREGYTRFFRRAGAWLALFHCFVANDMHQENMIATGDHPVPIDLETILQSTVEDHGTADPEAQAFNLATEKLANSVMMVGLLPAYGRSPENNVFAIGGMTADWNSKIKITWDNINSDEMRPAKSKEASNTNPNLPYVDGVYAKFADHIDDFVSGFEDYAKFLLRQSRDPKWGDMYEGFAGIPVRKVIRATRFYSMLLQRLKNHRTMDDGVIWSAQADFIARLAEWDKSSDVLWPLQRAERSALLALNVPHFFSPSDENDIRDATGHSIRIGAESGLSRARARVQDFDEREIDWQIEVISQNTTALSKSNAPIVAGQTKLAERSGITVPPTKTFFIAEADKIAEDLSRYAIRRGPGAAWIGLDCLGDAEVFQLVCLGPDLYNGVSGIAVFLAAHAAGTGRQSSAELARAGVAHLRKNLKGRNTARMARSLGVGGATGLGSIVYALAVMSKLLHDDGLLADAHVAAELFIDDLIRADKQLDVVGGSAGAILCLLRLYRDSKSVDVLNRAIKCGEHLIAQSRLGPEGRRSWVGQGFGKQALNGMSHGAAGFAYALASLSAAAGREEFAQAASECIAFENSSYDANRNNWPDLRGEGQPSWPCQWCHGAPGIGLARIAMIKRGVADPEILANDIRNAVEGTTRGWPGAVDTLCCGTLGSVEFFCEASSALRSDDLRELASRRLAAVLETAASKGDYRWNSGKRQFNLGLFRGLAGVGYTSLRQADGSLPNVIIWE
ncbi:MAG: type 2 lanthipeptide synthetase LanM family protein [Pseudolabrys sp.]